MHANERRLNGDWIETHYKQANGEVCKNKWAFLLELHKVCNVYVCV